MNDQKNIVYFDLETQKSFQQVGGRSRPQDLKLSVAVTYSTAQQRYHVYLEEDVDELITELTRADLVVGHNIKSFDYYVLSAYSVLDLSQAPTLDTLEMIEKACGLRLGLGSIAQATLGIGKTADGKEALKWFQEGKWQEIAEYCCYDVKVTKLIHEFGKTHGRLFYFDKVTGQRKSFEVSWN